MLHRRIVAQVFGQLLRSHTPAGILPKRHSVTLKHVNTHVSTQQQCYFSGQDNAKCFQLQQPPYRLAIMCPHVCTAVEVITGGFESIQVCSDSKYCASQHLVQCYELPLKRSVLLQILETPLEDGANQLSIQHHGSTVCAYCRRFCSHYLSTVLCTSCPAVLTGELNSAKAAEQVAGPRSITAQVPERYCDVDIYTAGTHIAIFVAGLCCIGSLQSCRETGHTIIPVELTTCFIKWIVTEYEQGVYAPALTVSANAKTVLTL